MEGWLTTFLTDRWRGGSLHSWRTDGWVSQDYSKLVSVSLGNSSFENSEEDPLQKYPFFEILPYGIRPRDPHVGS